MLRRRALPLLLLPAPALAQPRPLRIIVPFAPGGSGDITARLIGQHIEGTTGQPVVVDNRPGANGVIGTMAVKQAAPDGHTLLLATTSTHSANPSTVRDLPYDPLKDFTTIGFFGSNGSYLMVKAEAPFRDVAGLLAEAKRRQVFFGHFNASSRVPGALLAVMSGVPMQDVPYRAIGSALADLLAGRLDFIFVDTTAGDAWLRQNQTRALAITRQGRWARWPDLPALSETWPDFVLTGFLGMAVPAATPPEVAARLNALVNAAILAEPARSRLVEFGFVPEALSLTQIAALVRQEQEKWARFVQMAGIEPE
ncbi:tripartite tricarboxylate transporter substrate binding protein [Siccirubricoccus sp. KC 17139]|uniref:Tripartite tricarboxylate transporter substrate binding protein n=1 Tax=Siccirubricoccus soli TaxID=2899147 RepID=A0ABT1D9I5_9PROT|nr:tripartite tricarboxylate transporter substrate binding protein [Siccirubricoccus soli]MCO6418587.1 tripartite tricarboxylate transporter substrate binding protein [Siccirubricoccus soli]MCP2684722.1 tripartite tricarboxylate transporter substrate binding protein [Siccirubricoccus soli]